MQRNRTYHCDWEPDWKPTKIYPNTKVKGEKIRYVLTIEHGDSKKNDNKLLVIMMNPSQADKNQSDITTNNILKWCGNYQKITTVNVIPNYSTQPANIDLCSKEIREKNICIIKRLINDYQDIVFATGSMAITPKNKNHLELENAFIEDYQKILRYARLKQNDKNFFVFKLIKHGFGHHPNNRLKFEGKLISVDIQLEFFLAQR